MLASRTPLSRLRYRNTGGRFRASLIDLVDNPAFTAASSQAVPLQVISSRATLSLPETPLRTDFPTAARCWTVNSRFGLSLSSVMAWSFQCSEAATKAQRQRSEIACRAEQEAAREVRSSRLTP